MEGYVLIAAMVVLGSTIATVGDRLGSKVGKKRLTIFKLRPRDTATLVTIATGGLISAVTMGILLAVSQDLREALTRFREIRRDLAQAQTRLAQADRDLKAANEQRDRALTSLQALEQQRTAAQQRQREAETALAAAQAKLATITAELSQVQAQEAELRQKAETLSQELQTLSAESQTLRQERETLRQDLQRIAQEQETLRRQAQAAQNRLALLATQRAALDRELQELNATRDRLQASVQVLRRGNVAIFTDEILAAQILRLGRNRTLQRVALTPVLAAAERQARELLRFPPGEEPRTPILDVDSVGRVLDWVARRVAQDGEGEYVVRLLAASNHVEREQQVFLKAEVSPNRRVFHRGQTIVALPFAAGLPPQEAVAQVQKLFELANFRAKQEGVLDNPRTGTVGQFSTEALSNLLQTITQINGAYEIVAVAKEPIFTASPLTLELIVRSRGAEVGRFS